MTKNNSISMRTEVETYIIEETQELIYDNEKLDQWNMHVDALGLKGQKAICKPDKSPIPFLHMKNSLVNVFSVLCPCKVDISDYDKTPIPVEILELAALAKREGYFSKIQIWFDEKSPDPACVGLLGSFFCYNRSYGAVATVTTESEAIALKESGAAYGYNFHDTGKYLIGRWADVKASLEELTVKARKMFVFQKSGELNQQIRDAKRKIEDLEHEASLSFGVDGHDIEAINLPF